MTKVSVLIPAFSQAKADYLNLCIESLKNQDHNKIDLEVFIMHGHDMQPYYIHDNIKFEIRKYGNHLSQNHWLNLAAKEATGEFIIIGNDDIIFGNNSIANMVQIHRKFGGIIQPISQNEVGLLYMADFDVCQHAQELKLKRYMRMEEIKGFERSIMNFDTGMKHDLAFPMQWVCMYSTLVKRDLWLDLGGFDTDTYQCGQVDVDFCLRAAKDKKTTTFVTPNAFTFHFGGVTTTTGLSDEVRIKDLQAFKKRWGFII